MAGWKDGMTARRIEAAARNRDEDRHDGNRGGWRYGTQNHDVLILISALNLVHHFGSALAAEADP